MSKDEFVESSGNVFADMGLEDADELMARAELGYAVRKRAQENGLKQRELALLLGAGQAEVSKLMNGKYHLFTEGRLLGFLSRLGYKTVIHIEPRKQGDRALELV